jgi:hypothetical protein
MSQITVLINGNEVHSLRKELNPELFKKLPIEIIYEICILTGKFRLRINKKVNKLSLYSCINLHEPKWIYFNTDFYRHRIHMIVYPFFIINTIHRNGDLSSRIIEKPTIYRIE